MPPINLLIKPASSLCNMRCKYCFYADVAESREMKSYGIMTDETLEDTVRKAFAYATGYAGFAFQGGEPTLAGLDFYRRLIELQEKYNTRHIPVENAIQTNGYRMNDEWAAFFAEHHFLVGLSMDGTREAHNEMRVDAAGKGTFDAVVRAANLLEKHKVEFNILCVVNEYVARHPQKVYNQLKKYRFVQFIPCLDTFEGEPMPYSLKPETYGNFLNVTFDNYYRDYMSGHYVSIRNFDNYIHILMGHRPENCAMNGICTCYFVIEGDGSVFPCDFYVLDEWKLGNVRTDTFTDMLESLTAHRFVDVSRHVSEACKTCRYYALCRGGCRRDREPIIDDKPSLNRLCSSYKVFFDHSADRMAEIARHQSRY